ILGEFGVLFAGLGVVAAQQPLAGFLEGGAVGAGERGGAEGEQAGTEVSHRSVLARTQVVCCYLSRRGGKTQAAWRGQLGRRRAPGLRTVARGFTAVAPRAPRQTARRATALKPRASLRARGTLRRPQPCPYCTAAV